MLPLAWWFGSDVLRGKTPADEGRLGPEGTLPGLLFRCRPDVISRPPGDNLVLWRVGHDHEVRRFSVPPVIHLPVVIDRPRRSSTTHVRPPARLRGQPVAVVVDPVAHFLSDRDDTRSNFYLENAATASQIQGRELDWVCVTWDADLRFTGGHWTRGLGIRADAEAADAVFARLRAWGLTDCIGHTRASRPRLEGCACLHPDECSHVRTIRFKNRVDSPPSQLDCAYGSKTIISKGVRRVRMRGLLLGWGGQGRQKVLGPETRSPSGSTCGFRTHFRSLVAIQPTPKTSSQRMAESCAAINIIVIIMKPWNCRFSVIKSKEIIELTAHRSVS